MLDVPIGHRDVPHPSGPGPAARRPAGRKRREPCDPESVTGARRRRARRRGRGRAGGAPRGLPDLPRAGGLSARCGRGPRPAFRRRCRRGSRIAFARDAATGPAAADGPALGCSLAAALAVAVLWGRGSPPSWPGSSGASTGTAGVSPSCPAKVWSNDPAVSPVVLRASGAPRFPICPRRAGGLELDRARALPAPRSTVAHLYYARHGAALSVFVVPGSVRIDARSAAGTEPACVACPYPCWARAGRLVEPRRLRGRRARRSYRPSSAPSRATIADAASDAPSRAVIRG